MDSEAEDNNRRRVPEHLEISAQWRADSAAYRNRAREIGRTDLDQPYGPGERQRYDLFFSGTDGAPLVADRSYGSKDVSNAASSKTTLYVPPLIT